MIITFNRSFTDQFGINVLNLRRIRFRYQKSAAFLWDVFANFPSEILVIVLYDLFITYKFRFILFLRLNRLMRYRRMKLSFGRWYYQSQKLVNLNNEFKFVQILYTFLVINLL